MKVKILKWFPFYFAAMFINDDWHYIPKSGAYTLKGCRNKMFRFFKDQDSSDNDVLKNHGDNIVQEIIID